MAGSGVENEVKFMVSDLGVIETRLASLGARLEQARTYEQNLRFDTPGHDLDQHRQVLRLRQDTTARLTYKGPGQADTEVSTRQEIEFEVSDFDSARKFLEALGYEILLVYEKYRAAYLLDEVEVVLDEMPFGNFIEIEGPDAAAIQAAAEKLGVDWEARILDNYMALFARVKEALGLDVRDLTFENFSGKGFSPQEINLSLADD